MFYATSYNPERAQAEISRLLLSIGARRISVEYNERRDVAGMSFTLDTSRGAQEFLLPLRTDRVLSVLKRQGVLKGLGAARRRADPDLQRRHTESVAWRTLLEWLKLQAAIIETEQGSADEIMLPYMLVGADADGARYTVYEQFLGDRALPAAAGS